MLVIKENIIIWLKLHFYKLRHILITLEISSNFETNKKSLILSISLIDESSFPSDFSLNLHKLEFYTILVGIFISNINLNPSAKIYISVWKLKVGSSSSIGEKSKFVYCSWSDKYLEVCMFNNFLFKFYYESKKLLLLILMFWFPNIFSLNVTK